MDSGRDQAIVQAEDDEHQDVRRQVIASDASSIHNHYHAPVNVNHIGHAYNPNFGANYGNFNQITQTSAVPAALYYGQSMGSNPMKILSDARAVEATHTSKTASYAPKCKPGSRALIIQDATDWVTSGGSGKEAGAPTTSVLCLQGPAGGGKTCIMREVVSRCVKLGLLAASYFFSSRIPRLDNEEAFIATIVYQLAGKSPLLKATILQTISDEPDIFQESLDAQMERLVLDPLNSIDSPFPHHPNAGSQKRVIVVDGFDECRDPKERTHLLEMLFTIVTSTPHFLVIIASRPEFDIRTAFATQPLASVTRLLRLEDYNGYSDIRTFCCDEFRKIREKHPAKAAIPPDWPSEDLIAILVDKSSGSYIYPSTVVKHVDNPHRNPVSLLEEVISLTTNHSGSAHLLDLDKLYTHVLHPPSTDMVLLKRILHCIMDMKSSHSPSFLDEFLSLPPGTTEMTLCDLHSVVKLPAPGTEGNVHFHHKSMSDYLRSPQRAGDLYQPPYKTSLDLAATCIVHLRKTPLTGDLGGIHFYSLYHWCDHLDQAFEFGDAPGPALEYLPESIRLFNPMSAWVAKFTLYQCANVFGSQWAQHDRICKPLGSGPCIPLCTHMKRVEALSKKFNEFVDRRSGHRFSGGRKRGGMDYDMYTEFAKQHGWVDRSYRAQDHRTLPHCMG